LPSGDLANPDRYRQTVLAISIEKGARVSTP
jgi:hypothetical protein